MTTKFLPACSKTERKTKKATIGATSKKTRNAIPAISAPNLKSKTPHPKTKLLITAPRATENLSPISLKRKWLTFSAFLMSATLPASPPELINLLTF